MRLGLDKLLKCYACVRFIRSENLQVGCFLLSKEVAIYTTPHVYMIHVTGLRWNKHQAAGSSRIDWEQAHQPARSLSLLVASRRKHL